MIGQKKDEKGACVRARVSSGHHTSHPLCPRDKIKLMKAQRGDRESSGSSSSSRKAPRGPWECVVCTFANAATARKCGMCRRAREGSHPTSSQRSSTASATSNALSDEPPPSDGWGCDACTYVNKSSARVCVVCKTKRPALKPQYLTDSTLKNAGVLNSCKLRTQKKKCRSGVFPSARTRADRARTGAA